MANYPSPNKTDMGNPMQGVQANQPPVAKSGKNQIIDGKSLLKANGVGKLNENRSTTLRPMGKQLKPNDP